MRERHSGQKHQVFAYHRRQRRAVSSQGARSLLVRWETDLQLCWSQKPVWMRVRTQWHSQSPPWLPHPSKHRKHKCRLAGTYLLGSFSSRIQARERRGDQKGEDAVKHHLSPSPPMSSHHHFFSNPFSTWKANNGHA